VLSPAFIGGISPPILKTICAQQAQADPPSPSDERRAMAGQVKKRSPPHILADEHFKEVCDAP